tara:strand:+ start:176 stop:310 length:135 start_codon:yes stop_codon:yes gene_type:complete
MVNIWVFVNLYSGGFCSGVYVCVEGILFSLKKKVKESKRKSNDT